ncbi:MAG TPA: hypothetical protein VFS27_13070 [Blastocatellia bacterium]|jgi:uncharacterized protein involved in exopolysaccharide biosynthesis|nr:hypothetical protein [Blastocatellia bacterium]
MEIMRPRGLFEYAGILWRKKALILLVAVSVTVATSQIIRHIPNIYESHASIAISNQGAGDDRSSPVPSLSNLTQRMTSQGNLAEIVRRYNLYPQPPKVIEVAGVAGLAGRSSDQSAAVERLRRSIKIDIKMRNYYPDAPESLTVSYRYTDPVIAQSVVSDLISIFEETNVKTQRQIEAELEQFRSMIAEIETQLQKLAPQRDLALIRTGSGENSSSAVRAQRLAAADSIGSLGDREYMLRRQIDEQKRQIAEQEKLVGSTAATNRLAGNSAYGVLLARRAEVEGQIRDLSRSATEKNPKMLQARAQLTAINQEISRLESAGGANSGSAANSASPEARELRAMFRDLQRMETELEVTQRDLSRKTQGLKELPKEVPNAALAASASSTQLNEAKAEYDRLLGRYNWLMDKQESLLKLSGDGGRKGEIFQLIDAPITQLAPVGPNRILLTLIGLGIALAAGLLIASAREVPRLFLIHNDRDVEYYLGTRVLAAIPETLTPFQRGRRRILWGLRWLGVVLILGAMVPVLIMALDRSQLFQTLANR